MNEDHRPETAVETLLQCSESFNHSLLRAIQESSPEGILVVDQDASVVSYNQRFLDIFHIPTERLRPDRSRDGRIPDHPVLITALQQVKDPEGVARRIQELYADPNATDDCEIELKDGRTIRRHSTGLFGDDGAYFGRVWFFLDISEHKRAQQELQELAWRDPLTGAMNRRHFFERADEEMVRARRYRHPLAVVMLDLDHFKNINDAYGHAAGDRILQTVSAQWTRLLRSVDLFARIGGEEFVVLMPDSPLDAAGTVAERLRDSVAESTIEFEGQDIRCTASAGVTMLNADDGSIEDVLRRADDALYRAKSEGRDRVEVNP